MDKIGILIVVDRAATIERRDRMGNTVLEPKDVDKGEEGPGEP